MLKIFTYSFIVVVLIATTALCVLVPTRHFVSMNLVDRYREVLADGKTLVYYCVQVSDYDSLLFCNYTTTMYHKEINDSLDQKEAVEMLILFFKESNLEELDNYQLLQLTHGDTSKLDRYKNLEKDSSAYVGVRFSDTYRMIGRDTLYVLPRQVMVPRNGTQLKDYFQQAATHQ